MLRNHETIIYWGIHELTNLVNTKEISGMIKVRYVQSSSHAYKHNRIRKVVIIMSCESNGRKRWCFDRIGILHIKMMKNV